MFRKLIKSFVDPFLQKWFNWYLRKPRFYKYNGLNILVQPKVFPPFFTISTKLLLRYIKTLDLKNKQFLELGCGSGIISLFAASKGANVTASDINKIALTALKENAKKNQLEINVIYSNLFDKLRNISFDFIIINPPYYPKPPLNTEEKAWYCGEHFEYFIQLFKELNFYLNTFESNIYMILSEDCNITKIVEICEKNNLKMELIKKKMIFFETNYIYKILLNI